ncbi:MAG: pyridoxamine 5'-phosphate oxidase family protein [Treponema sp.]|jgi:uncharacterized pyridoxamine 5'-phosphate oxidase family protein|nr:pyridoxamine 5'-phosphate oxidase family protein [Treponema sp.]
MEEILKFLQDSEVFYLATVESDQPRVRPMGFVMVYDGKLCFCTSNKKDMFRQMKNNPKVEVCASKDGKWLRISGKVVFNPDKAAKEKALEVRPNLKNKYSVNDDIFEIFHFESATAVFSDMQGGRKEVKI